MREREGYKYLGVLEADGTLHDTIKKKIAKEYLRRVRKVAQCKLAMGLSEVRGGMTMSRTVYLKMRIRRCCGTLV